MSSLYKPSPGDEAGTFADRFSQTAFSRGNMAGAVMRGNGEMMLLSSLKRTVGQTQPENYRQRMLFQSGTSAKRNIGGHRRDKVIFNKGEVYSAVGLVVDAAQNARRTVDTLAELAEGGNSLPEGSGAETLIKQYPFLSDERERGLLEKYSKASKQLGGSDAAERRLVLEKAHQRTQALIAKKQQMRFGFTQHLRFLSGRAQQAAEVFEDEAFKQTLLSHIEEYNAAPPPPDDDGGKREDSEEGGSEHTGKR